MAYKYDYAHRMWAKDVKADSNGRCWVCGRKPKRLHAHHVYGTECAEGRAVCPTCHSILTALTGHGRKMHETPAQWRKMLWLVKERKRGHPSE